MHLTAPIMGVGDAFGHLLPGKIFCFLAGTELIPADIYRVGAVFHSCFQRSQTAARRQQFHFIHIRNSFL